MTRALFFKYGYIILIYTLMDSDILYSLDNSNCVNPSVSMTCELMTGLLIPVTVGELQVHARFVDLVALLIHFEGSRWFFSNSGAGHV
jgi:hypothetical protein